MSKGQCHSHIGYEKFDKTKYSCISPSVRASTLPFLVSKVSNINSSIRGKQEFTSAADSYFAKFTKDDRIIAKKDQKMAILEIISSSNSFFTIYFIGNYITDYQAIECIKRYAFIRCRTIARTLNGTKVEQIRLKTVL